MSNWNINFTTLLRKDRSTMWGNWSLNQAIKPGAVGNLNPNTGDFTIISDSIPNANIADRAYTQKWDVKSTDVTVQKANVQLDGSATDPESGVKITAGVEVTWGFSKSGSLASTFATSKQSYLKDPMTLIKNQLPWLKTQAKNAGMSSSSGISQGFCVITDVIYANSGLNVGANAESSTFSITGSASGVDELTGDSASGKGSYTSTSESASMDKHLWPAKANTISPAEVPIAFVVASFKGETIIPAWTKMVSSYELNLNNNFGGTYIAHGTLTYMVDGIMKVRKNSASGALTSTIGDIPFNATNLVYEVTFVASGTKKTFNWATPITQWASGSRNIDVRGVWPSGVNATDREAGN